MMQPSPAILAPECWPLKPRAKTMAVQTLSINGRLVSARADETILEAARAAGIQIPTLCHLDGLSDIGACRLCLVEIAGSHKLHPACITKVAEGMQVTIDSA